MPLFIENPILLIYFLISSLLLLLSTIAVYSNSKALDVVTFLFVYMMAVFFYGFRPGETTDLIMYLRHYDEMTDFDSFPWGIGFYSIMKPIKFFFRTHESYVFLSSALLLSLLSVVIIISFKKKNYKSLILISTFLSWNMLDQVTNTFRQGVAVPFILLALFYIAQKRLILALVMSLIACSIHWSAILICLFVFVSYQIKSKNEALKYLSILTISLLAFSYFVNFNLSQMLTSSGLLSGLQTVFIGVDLNSKLDAYLGAGVEGANFYDMVSYRRIYYTSEVLIGLIVNVSAYLYLKNRTPDFDDNKVYKCYYAFFIIVSFYGVLLISMTWFVRNFAWAIPLLPLLYAYNLNYLRELNRKHHQIFLAAYAVCVFAMSLFTFWRLPLLNMSYPSF